MFFLGPVFIHLCYFLFGFPPDPDNKRMARNVLKYERLLSQNALQMATETVIQRPNVPNLQTRDTYEGLCQTLGSQVGFLREIDWSWDNLREKLMPQRQYNLPNNTGVISSSITLKFQFCAVALRSLTLLFLYLLYSFLPAHTLPEPQTLLLLRDQFQPLPAAPACPQGGHPPETLCGSLP